MHILYDGVMYETWMYVHSHFLFSVCIAVQEELGSFTLFIKPNRNKIQKNKTIVQGQVSSALQVTVYFNHVYQVHFGVHVKE